MLVYVFVPDNTDYKTEHIYAFKTIELLDKSVQMTYSKLGKITRVESEYFDDVSKPPIGRAMELLVLAEPEHL